MAKELEIILVNFEEHNAYCVPNPIKVFFDLAKTLNIKDQSFHYTPTNEILTLNHGQSKGKHNIIIDDLDENVMQLNFESVKSELKKIAQEGKKTIFIFSRKTTSWFDISTMAVKRLGQSGGFEIKALNFASKKVA